ncbi:LysR family transcriptional regulator [Paenibacillus pasadenensis]|uniref:LysR family transcriptional regulator n=1 Tax=Paenibacillus pasadenensis TaxID=217090 RepID=UPI000401108C|nr:LysR family transcriptional regulator [Paenibacillus pasadenensis]
MDIRQLTYFAAVARHGSFTKAARELHVTQPTLSKMVRLLEEELGATLFDRSSKQIALTDAGETILRSSQGILRSIEAMAAELDDLAQARKGTLRLGIPPMIGVHVFPALIERFHSRYPQIRLQLVERGGKRIEQEVDSGDLDVGLVILPMAQQEKFHLLPCLDEPLHLIAPRGHWAEGRASVELGELEREPFLLFRDEFTLHHLILDRCRQAGFEPDIVFESSQWDFMVQLVGARFGITLLPGGMRRSLDPERFLVIPVVRPTMVWSLNMIWKKDKYLSYAAREWIAFMQQEWPPPAT